MSSKALACRIALALAFFFLARVPGEAQSAAERPPGLQPGDRVRVTLAEGADGRETRVAGRFDRMGSESLSLDVGDSANRAVPRHAIVRVERSVRPSRKVRGALIGFGVGFATMFTLYSIDCFRGDGCAGELIGYSAILALPAAAVGAIVAPGEQWADASLRGRLDRPTSFANKGLQLRLVPMVGRRNGLTLVASF